MQKSHFIIVSQFNLPAKNNTLTDEWMEHRLQLLEHSTLKSLSAQTDKNFLYLLFCADDTPKRYRKALRKIMPKNSETVWVSRDQINYPGKNSSLLLREAGTALIKPYIKPDNMGMVYTTHIGTDDALAKDYVSNVQKVYDWEQNNYHGFFSYTTGYVFLTRRKRFNLIDDIRYFFLTLREPVKTFKGVLTYPHSRLHRVTTVVQLSDTEPMWVKVLHDHEIGTYAQWRRSFNKVTVDRDESHSHILKRFDIHIEGIVPNLKDDEDASSA